MLAPTSIPRQHPEIVARILENEAVLVLPVRGQVKVLNELGSRIWSLIDGIRTNNDIVQLLHNEFDVTLETLTMDTFAFIEQLADRGMIDLA
jgi:hypothetical protein